MDPEAPPPASRAGTTLLLSGPDSIAILARFPEASGHAALREFLVERPPRALVLVSSEVDHPALDLLVERASRFRDEAPESEAFETDPLEDARARLSTIRAARREPGADPALSALLADAASEVEVLAFRTAYALAVELGGPLATAEALSRLPDEIAADPAAWIRRLEPEDPDYPVVAGGFQGTARLLAAQRERGGEAPSDPGGRWGALRPDAVDPDVPGLRARLEDLGFSAPTIAEPERFDRALVVAVEELQDFHGLARTGWPDPPTLEVLATPLEDRLRRLGLVLQALRRSPARRHADRIEVNIPAFELRFFHGGRLERRHRVVVGSNRIARDPHERREGHLDRTPVLESRVTGIVLNPSWHVPRRIKTLELDPVAGRHPGFYDDFDLWTGADGIERAIQLPGRRNPLGSVKIVLEGSGGIYLHDTPWRKSFAARDRALSHGCVRVEDAKHLASRILDLDRHPLDPAGLERVLRTRNEVVVTLARRLPVFFSYRTAGTAADGTLRLWPDVYGWGPAVEPGDAQTSSPSSSESPSASK